VIFFWFFNSHILTKNFKKLCQISDRGNPILLLTVVGTLKHLGQFDTNYIIFKNVENNVPQKYYSSKKKKKNWKKNKEYDEIFKNIYI